MAFKKLKYFIEHGIIMLETIIKCHNYVLLSIVQPFSIPLVFVSASFYQSINFDLPVYHQTLLPLGLNFKSNILRIYIKVSVKTYKAFRALSILQGLDDSLRQMFLCYYCELCS